MKCPVCTGIDLKLAERHGVEIDYCPECRGIWLDRGELDKIIERSEAPATASYTQAPPQHQEYEYNQPVYRKSEHDSHKYGHNGNYKKKSWLAELFD